MQSIDFNFTSRVEEKIPEPFFYSGLHRLRVLEIDELARLRVEPLEAIDGTPVLDIKPALSGTSET